MVSSLCNLHCNLGGSKFYYKRIKLIILFYSWDVVVVCVGIGDAAVWVLRIGDNIRPYLCWTIEMKIFLLVEHSEILF